MDTFANKKFISQAIDADEEMEKLGPSYNKKLMRLPRIHESPKDSAYKEVVDKNDEIDEIDEDDSGTENRSVIRTYPGEGGDNEEYKRDASEKTKLKSLGNANKVEEMNVIMKRHLSQFLSSSPKQPEIPNPEKKLATGYKLINKHYNHQPKSSLPNLKLIPGPTNTALPKKTLPVKATGDISVLNHGQVYIDRSEVSKQNSMN
jgi:hypothetical protein